MGNFEKSNNLNTIIQQIKELIESGNLTDSDLEGLRQALGKISGQTIQLGKYNVLIDEANNLHIGDRIYYSWDNEALKALSNMIRFGIQVSDGESIIRSKITENQAYCKNKIRSVNSQKENRLHELKANLQSNLMRLETDSQNNLRIIEIEHHKNRNQAINQLLVDLRSQKNDLESRYVKDGYWVGGRDEYEKHGSVVNNIEALSQRELGSLSNSAKKQIDDLERYFENQKAKLITDLERSKQTLKLNYREEKAKIEETATSEILRIESDGREEVYRFIIQLYLSEEGYPLSGKYLSKLKQFKLEIKMQKLEIERIEKSEIKPYYEDNLRKYEQEFTQRINQEGYPLSETTRDQLKPKQESLGLKNQDVSSSEELIIKPFYEENMRKYREEFRQIIEREGYPLSETTRDQLKQRQISLGLLGLIYGDVDAAEKLIIKPLYDENMRKYREEFIDLMNEKVSALTQESLAELRKKQNKLGLKSEDVQNTEQLVIKQFYQTNLDKYQKEFKQKIEQEGYPLNNKTIIRLKQRQELLGIKILGFNREDIEIVQRIIKNNKDKNKVVDYLSSVIFRENYQDLRDLLASKKWKEANEETKNILFKSINNYCQSQEEKNMMTITEEQIKMIDMLQIQMIDILWDVYSKGRFCFHKQRDIFITTGEKYKTFSENIGWKHKAFFLLDFLSWKSDDDIIFHIDAPEGHLPFWRPYISNGEQFLIELINRDIL